MNLGKVEHSIRERLTRSRHRVSISGAFITIDDVVLKFDGTRYRLSSRAAPPSPKPSSGSVLRDTGAFRLCHVPGGPVYLLHGHSQKEMVVKQADCAVATDSFLFWALGDAVYTSDLRTLGDSLCFQMPGTISRLVHLHGDVVQVHLQDGSVKFLDAT